ncbi:MAG: DNA primase family protein [Cetobacterium sp.]|uniref:DNA primase family protein n=1 Tax=Cetobacterium sp. TaxID=2071632 RepID=UPI003EE5BF8C
MLNNKEKHDEIANKCNQIFYKSTISSKVDFWGRFEECINLLLENNIPKSCAKIILQNISKTHAKSFDDINFYNLREIYETYFINYNVSKFIASTNFRYSHNIPMIYNLDDGTYKETEEQKIFQLLKQNISHLLPKDLKEIYESLKIEGYLDISSFNNYKTLNLIHCKNGMLDISNEEFNLIPLDPKYYSTTCLNAEFTKNSECPEWIKFLDKTFKLYHEDKEIAINLLKEFMGYSLVHGNYLQKMLAIIGKPRTGKSVIADILHELLGTQNTSAVSFDELNDSSKISPLIGKLANITGELAKGKKIDSSKIKSLIGEDYLTCKKVYKDPIKFKNDAKIISIGNYAPSFNETSNAMLERILVLNLDNVVHDNERDPLLKNKLKAEINGIFSWCIEGLLNLKKRGHFIEPRQSIISKEKINKSSNSIVEWLEENEQQIPWEEGYIITLKTLYDYYKTFCIENRVSGIESNSSFREYLKQIPWLTVFKDPSRNQFIVQAIQDETENNA